MEGPPVQSETELQHLFGVPVPPPAVRVVIRPVWQGSGPVKPLYDGRVEGVTDIDIAMAVSKNAAWWEYVEACVRSKRLEASADGTWWWKLRLTFYNGEGVGAEPVQTQEAHDFYRSTKGGGSEAEDAVLRLLQAGVVVLEKVGSAAAGAIERVATASANAIAEATKASANAIAEANKAGAGAVAEAAKAGGAALAEASKQTGEVSKLADKLMEDTAALKEVIFALQEERLKGAQKPAAAPKSMVEEAKELVDTVKTIKNLGEVFGGDDKPAGAGAPAPSGGAPSGAAASGPATEGKK